jgi:hypothetical protein
VQRIRSKPAPSTTLRVVPLPRAGARGRIRAVIARSQRVRPEVAGPMTGSATKQSIFPRKPLDCFADARNDDAKIRCRDASTRPSLAYNHPQEKFASTKREAKRRKAHADHGLRGSRRVHASCATHLPRGPRAFGARPPSGASTAALIRNCDVSDPAPGHASWDLESSRRYPLYPVPVQ